MTKRSSLVGSGRRRGGPVREGYKVIALLLKQSLGLSGLVGQHWVLLPHPGSATSHLIAPGGHHTLQHIHTLVLTFKLISLIEHCVTFRHDRRLLSLLGFVHNWPTSRWSARKKENRFSLNGNEIMSSFLGWQFYLSTLYMKF